ncbi:MAG: alpha/beta fold hydrolase [Gammaproteobacteria bacterium]|nr:alpha/beta fold hydrolase [Gammaproteobacteria bacterium]
MTTRYFFGRLIAVSATLLLGACAGLPLGIGGGRGDTATPDVRGFKAYEILYATDRSPPDADDVKKGLSFGKRRGPMSYGVATVTVPNLASTLVGEKTADTAATEKFDPNKHFTIQRLDTLGAPALLARVRSATAGAKPNDVLVYVHGYLNDFNAALFRAAQLKHDLEFPGLVVAYSWPSQGTAAGYTLDEANVEWSAHNFSKFLDSLTATTGNARVHVLAHSMGNRALAAALREHVCERGPEKLHHVILAAPDIDAEVFRRDVIPALNGAAQHVTLYVSEDDKALRASRVVHGYERAGETRIVARCCSATRRHRHANSSRVPRRMGSTGCSTDKK